MRSEFPLPSSQLRYPVSWPYLERSHVVVLKDGIPWPFEWVSGTEIDVDGGPDGVLPGVKLTILRITPDLESYAQIADATLLDADQLNRMRRQLLYLLQERAGGIAGYFGGAVNVVTSEIDRVNSALDNIDNILAQLMDGLLTLDDLNAAIVVATNVAQDTKNALIAEITASNAEFEALRNRTLGLEGGAVALGARITNETTVRQSGEEALAQSITETQAAIVDGDGNTLSAAVAQANLAIANAGNALASSIESVRAALENADTALDARIDTERIAWVHGDEVLATQISTVDARVTAEKALLVASITQVDQARIDADGILAQRVTSLEASSGSAEPYDDTALRALINIANEARITGDQALTDSLSTMQSTVGTQGNIIAQATDHISTLATRTGVVEAQRVIKTAVRSDGREVWAGIGLAATINDETGVTQSEVILMADRILLTPPGDPNGPATPFMATGTVDGVPTTVFPAAKYGDQSIGARVLVDGSIETRHMKVLGGHGAALNLDPTTADLSAWTWGWGGTLQVVALGDGASGAYAVRFTTIGNFRERTRFALKPSRQYRVSFWARKPAGVGLSFIRLITWNAAREQQSYIVYSTAPFVGTFEGVAIPSGWSYYEGYVTTTPYVVSGNLDIHANYNSDGSDGGGYTDFQAIRVEELLDSALIVQGGVKADRIDTEGLTIKRDGVVIFGGGVNLDWSRIVANSSWLNSNQQWSQVQGTENVETLTGAQAKADAARAAAVATAAAYALAQADLARIDAAAHADGIVDAEEARAIADATAKAEAARVAAVAAAATDAAVKADAARVAAVTAAAVDATNKAEAARAAAEAAAASYAAAQAELARVNAMAHADGIVDAEEARAIADASAKAEAARVAAVSTAAADATAKANVAATTAAWYGVTGTGKPEDYATNGATFGQNVWGQITAGNISTYIAGAAIDLAYINRASIASLSAITAVVGTLRTATYGARMEIHSNVQKVYDTSNMRRVQIGDLSL